VGASVGESSTNELYEVQNITTFEQLDANERFGILSHGTQSDPIYNYGNRASLALFEYTLETLCQTPSRYSTIETLVNERARLIQSIESVGHGMISDAIRVTSCGKLFTIKTVFVWNVYDDYGTRIGLAAWYDRSQVTDSVGRSHQ
jgi:MEKHLA domain